METFLAQQDALALAKRASALEGAAHTAAAEEADPGGAAAKSGAAGQSGGAAGEEEGGGEEAEQGYRDDGCSLLSCFNLALRSQLVNFRNLAPGGCCCCEWKVLEAVWLAAMPRLLSDFHSFADWKEG